MKDFNNNALKIGDVVAFIDTYSVNSKASRSSLHKGIIEAFTEKMVIIRCDTVVSSKGTIRRLPHHIALIQEHK
jgi:hypothetical protein